MNVIKGCFQLQALDICFQVTAAQAKLRLYSENWTEEMRVLVYFLQRFADCIKIRPKFILTYKNTSPFWYIWLLLHIIAKNVKTGGKSKQKQQFLLEQRQNTKLAMNQDDIVQRTRRIQQSTPSTLALGDLWTLFSGSTNPTYILDNIFPEIIKN